MAKYIAHASLDENGKISGGITGDNTGNEICIRTWYNKPWNYVFRIMDEKVRIQFANNMIDIARNNAVGYDQGQRNSLLTQAEKVNFDFTKITVKCECDCSSMVTIALLGAIYVVLGSAAYQKAKAVLVAGGNCATTSTMRSRFAKMTVVEIKAYNSSSYIATTDNAVYGDIYNREGSHVVAYIDDGNKKSFTRDYLMKGDEGKEVKEMQTMLIAVGYSCGSYGADGDFGEGTDKALRAFQKDYKLTVDGCYGSKSKAKLESVYKEKTAPKTTTNTTTKKYVYKGVDYSLVFDPVYYSDKYADLKRAFGTNENSLLDHFVVYGMKEKRQAISTFNVVAYKNRYADLRKAFGEDMPAYYHHYLQYGYKEKRNAM